MISIPTALNSLKRVAVAAAVLCSANAFAVAFPDFTVDKDRNAATQDDRFVADKIIGGYVERIVFTGPSSFTFSLRWTASAFFSGNGENQVANALLREITVPDGEGGTITAFLPYGLYAEATGSGTFAQSGGITTFTLNPALGSLQLYYDRQGNTKYLNDTDGSTPGNDITSDLTLFAKSNTGDDIALLTSASPLSGTGKLDPSLETCDNPATPNVFEGINCGSFGQTSQITLNADGRKYFIAPPDFYTLAFNSGQLNNFDVSGVQVINGSMDVVFRDNQIPEPTTLALLGGALLAFGAARAKRRTAR